MHDVEEDRGTEDARAPGQVGGEPAGGQIVGTDEPPVRRCRRENRLGDPVSEARDGHGDGETASQVRNDRQQQSIAVQHFDDDKHAERGDQRVAEEHAETSQRACQPALGAIRLDIVRQPPPPRVGDREEDQSDDQEGGDADGSARYAAVALRILAP